MPIIPVPLKFNLTSVPSEAPRGIIPLIVSLALNNVDPDGSAGIVNDPIVLEPGHVEPSFVAGLERGIVNVFVILLLPQLAVKPCPTGMVPWRHNEYPVVVGAVGVGLIVTVCEAVDAQPLTFSPETVYVVVEEGEAKTEEPVVKFNPVEGDQK